MFACYMSFLLQFKMSRYPDARARTTACVGLVAGVPMCDEVSNFFQGGHLVARRTLAFSRLILNAFKNVDFGNP